MSEIIKSVPLPGAELRRQAIQELLDRGVEASPENLLQASLCKGAPLYDYFAAIPKAKWAQIGQYHAARVIIDKTKVEYVIGGKIITARMVEFVRDDDGDGSYRSMREIISNSELQDRYMAEVAGLMQQAQQKMENLRALLRASHDAEPVAEDTKPKRNTAARIHENHALSA